MSCSTSSDVAGGSSPSLVRRIAESFYMSPGWYPKGTSPRGPCRVLAPASDGMHGLMRTLRLAGVLGLLDVRTLWDVARTFRSNTG